MGGVPISSGLVSALSLFWALWSGDCLVTIRLDLCYGKFAGKVSFDQEEFGNEVILRACHVH